MAGATYYTLVASLPRLVHFEAAGWLPISRKQIEERLSMLSEQDLTQLRLAEALVAWQRQPITRTTHQLRAGYRTVQERSTSRALREFVDFRMGQRTALVALRRRRRGMGPPQSGETWGVGPWVPLIHANWDRPGLGIRNLLPSIDEAAALLESGRAVDLERLLMDTIWQRLARIADQSPFGFERVFAFVFQWDIVQRWLSYDAVKAKARFQELIEEVTRDHQQLFA